MMHKDGRTKGAIQGNEDILFLDRRQASLIFAGLIAFTFFVFVAGYFWGKKHAVEHLVHRATYDSFADQAYGASLTSSARCSSEDEHSDKTDSPNSATGELASSSLPQLENNRSEVRYGALLAGFGSECRAQQLVDRLMNKGVLTHLKKRWSKTPRGKMVSWYQVETQPYVDRDQLQKLIDKVQKLEKIKNIQIVVMGNTGNN